MLTIGNWLVNALHLGCNLLVEVLRGQEILKVRLFHIHLISRVSVGELLGTSRLPFLKRDKVIIEDFLGVDLDQAPITVVGDSSTIVGFGNQILNSLPRNRSLLVILLRGNAIL
jgi:hypothetical protein